MDEPNYVVKSFEGVLQPRVVVPGKKRYRLRELERKASPFEIRFYDDYMVIYREKYICLPNNPTMDFKKFYFRDIKECVYRLKANKIDIFGTFEGIQYEYQPDGTLPEMPTYHKTVKNGIWMIYIGFDPDTDIVQEIEAHSPIKVIAENS